VKIPLVDLRAQYASMAKDIDAALHRVVDRCEFILGPEVQAFEQEWAAYCEAIHAVGLSNGTDALRLALLALDVRPGSEVLTVANTFFATGEAIATVGARPVFVDTDPRTQTMDPNRLAAAITPRTRAILPVHLYGQPAEMEPILGVAAEHGLPVIEDAAQAHGARYGGRPAGTLGAIGCFSFYPGKNLGAYGDAGAVVTNDAHLAETVRLLRDHGRRTKYVHTHIAYSCRMDGMQAAILRAKLPYLERWNKRRRQLVALYRELLDEEPSIYYIEQGKNLVSAHHLMVVEVEDRDEVQKRLVSRGIGAGVHYPVPLHLQPAFGPLGYKEGQLPVTEASCRRVLSLPLYPELTDEQVRFTVRQLRLALAG
jgi:dTDP-4-amino-4,6-dideoxygalactose transaminase